MTEQTPLVLIHGFTGCAEVWGDVRRALEGSHSCVCIELPGHGHKRHLTDPRLFEFAAVTDAIRDEISGSGAKQVDLWGYSLGGRLALQLALASPELVRALVLESTSPGIADVGEREARMHSDDNLAARIESDGLESFVDYWMNQPIFGEQKSLPQDRLAAGRRLRLHGTAVGYARALRGFSVGRQEPLHNRLQELTMPVMVAVGELDVKYRNIGVAMADSIPRAQFRIIRGVGHAPHWEKPEETAACVHKFLIGEH